MVRQDSERNWKGKAGEAGQRAISESESEGIAECAQRSVRDRPYAKYIPAEGGAEQAHRAGCDINVIVKQMEKNGMAPHVQRGEGVFGDFSGAPTLHEAYERVFQATEAFEQLPSSVRSAAMNSPVRLLEMLDDETGFQILTEAGLDVVTEGYDGQAGDDPLNAADPAQDPPRAEPDSDPNGERDNATST